jgi:hypothetical protein
LVAARAVSGSEKPPPAASAPSMALHHLRQGGAGYEPAD